MKRLIVVLLLAVLVAIGCVNSVATAVPAPTAVPATATPQYEMWQPGQSGYFLCEGGWQEEFYGQSFWQKCLPATGKRAPMATPEPGHYLWEANQNGYFLCENNWYSENYGQSVYRLCPTGEKNEG